MKRTETAWKPVLVLIALSSPPLSENTYKQTAADSHPTEKSFCSITTISSNQWKPLRRGNESNDRLYFLPFQRLVYFCFPSYGGYVRKDKHSGWLIIDTGTFPANNAGFIPRPLTSSALLFFAWNFLRLWSEKENRVGNGEAFMGAVWGLGVR